MIGVDYGPLTVAFMLIVVRDEIRSFTDTIGICRNTVAVKQILSSGADDAIIGSTRRTRFAGWRARGAIGSTTEATIWTDRASGSYGLDGITLGFVVRVLGKTCLACNASPGLVRTLGACELTH